MKEKSIIGIIIIFLALLAVVFYLGSRNTSTSVPETTIDVTAEPLPLRGAKDTTYTIDGQEISLVGSVLEKESAPGSAAKIRISIFGDLTLGDVNGDGQNDAALILTQDGGGSGTFYYLAVAYSTSTGIVGTNALLLGDRIAPETLEIRDGLVIVNYATRKSDEPMTAAPSVGVSLYAHFYDGVLIDVTKEVTKERSVKKTIVE